MVTGGLVRPAGISFYIIDESGNASLSPEDASSTPSTPSRKSGKTSGFNPLDSLHMSTDPVKVMACIARLKQARLVDIQAKVNKSKERIEAAIEELKKNDAIEEI